MNKAIEKATELGQAILESSEFIAYQKSREAIEQGGLLDISAAYERAITIVNSGIDKNSKLVQDAHKIINEVKNNSILIDYFDAKDRLSFLLDTINETLSHITGMDAGSSGCRGGCGGCKGCK